MKKTVAIVGAGLTGLTVARGLQEGGLQATLFEKSKGVGGRMATRRDSHCTYDHGAQFFAEGPQETFHWKSRWQNEKLVHLWFTERDRNHFCAAGGMTRFAKNLAVDQNIFFNEKVIALQVLRFGVELECESGNRFAAESVVLTAPLPQSIELLRASELIYPSSLESIRYARALVGLFEVDQEIDDFKYINPGTCLFSIANNRSKGISSVTALTVVMDPEFSQKRFDESDQAILKTIVQELENFFKFPIRIKNQQLKKWKFSHPLSTHPEKFCSLYGDRLILAGDAFGGGSLNGAVRSAQAVLEQFAARN